MSEGEEACQTAEWGQHANAAVSWGSAVQADGWSALIYGEQSSITKLQWLKLDPYTHQTEG